MHEAPATSPFGRFAAVAAAHLAGDGGYGPIPDAARSQLPAYRMPLFGRSRTSGMAVNIDLVALCPADGLSPADLDARLDGLAALVGRFGEQGNVEAQHGGKGRQVTALLLWVFTDPAPAGRATAAAALRREVRGSSFGRWPVYCATVLLTEGQVALPSGIQGRRRARLATELLQACLAAPTTPPLDRPGGGKAQTNGDQARRPEGRPAVNQPQQVAAQQRRRDLAGVLSGGPAPATYALLALIGLFFVALQLSGGSTSSRVLIRFGALVTPLVLAGQWWRLVSAAFLHIGWAHIAFNGFALYIYGPLVERLYGPARFLTIYLLAAIAGDLLSLPFVDGISAGASGAIFGLFGATISLVLRHRRRLPSMIREPLWRNAVAVVVLNAVLSVAVAGINLYAHAGGFLAGLLLGALLQPRPLVGGRRQGALGAAVGIAVAAVSVLALLLAVGDLSL